MIPDCILDEFHFFSKFFFFFTKDGLFKCLCVEGSKKTLTSGSALNQLANRIGISLMGPKATFTLSANVLHQPLKNIIHCKTQVIVNKQINMDLAPPGSVICRFFSVVLTKT